MSEELLQANGTGGAAALTAKAARNGRHANRKLARKGGGFADALAAVAAGSKAAPKRAAAPAGGASASPLEAKALPANDPSPARAKEAHRRTKGAAPALDAAPGLPVPGEAPRAARTRPAQSRPVADIGSPAVAPDGLPSPASGDRLRANRPAEGIPPAEAARVEGAPRTAAPHGAVPPEPTGPTGARVKDHGRKAEAREAKDAESSVQPASTPDAAIDPLAAGLMAASMTTTAQSRLAGDARESAAGRRRHEPGPVAAHDSQATARKPNARIGDRHEVSGSRSGKRDFDAPSPGESVPAAAGPAAADSSSAPAVAHSREFGHAKAAGHRAARPHAPVGMQAGPAAAPADVAARTDGAATQPIAAEGDIAARNAQGARANAPATPDRQSTTPGKNASGSTAAAAPASGSRLDGPVARPAEAAAEPRGAAVAPFAPRPVDPSASPVPAAAAADALASGERPARHAAATAKADAPSHGAREAISATPVVATPAGDAPGERNDAAAGNAPQPFFAAAAEPARRADGVAPFAPLPETAPVAPPDFAPLHEQVGMRLSTLPDGAHEVSLQLSPENLGNLRIDLKLSGGRMDAVVRAESPEAREALLRDIPALREALASSGITLSSFDVSLAGGNSPEQHAPRQAGGWETGQGHRSRREGEAESAPGSFRPGRGSSQNETAGAAGGHWIA